MTNGIKLARRAFLIGSSALVGGVAFGAYIVDAPIENPLLHGLGHGEAAITPFVKITATGITLIAPRADIGQGIASTQAVLIAEELDVDPHSVSIEPGQPHQAYYNGTVAAEGIAFPSYDTGFVPETVRDLMRSVTKVTAAQFTGGSSSTTDLQLTLRTAGAVARETLKKAAARRTGTKISELKTSNANVILPDGELIAYTDLAEDAAKLRPVKTVKLRAPDEWRLLGTRYKRTDIEAKSTGAFRYGIDVSLPDMLHATVISNPGRGGGLETYDARPALAMRGVKSVVAVTDGIGVIADNSWRAFKAAERVEVSWSAPDYPPTSAEMWDILSSSDQPRYLNSRLKNNGNVERAQHAGEVIQAEYRVPFLAHAPMEPLNATVLVEPDSVTIWTATQLPHVIVQSASELTGIDRARITVHALPGGGSFGRRLDHDYVVQAIQIAKSSPGVPVKTTWSREADMAQDFPRPAHLGKARGTVADGKVQSFDLDSISPSLLESWFGRVFIVPPGPDFMLVWGAFDQPYAIPNYRVSGYAAPLNIPVGSWRSPGACSNGFLHEGFLSELIHAAGADPLEERLRLIDNEDSKRVLEAVGEMAEWTGPDIGPGRGRGIAFVHSHGVPVAEIIDVTATDDGIRIDDVWIAADCGTVFDPVNAEAQLMGAAIWALGHAMNCELTYENFAPVQTNFHTFSGMRLNQAPRIHTRLLGQAKHIRGLGEPSTPPAAPALADAIFGATGIRLREMPFDKSVKFVS